MQIVEKELGKPIAELFASFAPEPFAAASTAQVHKAALQDGTPVVVKVQRPNIVPTINADLEILGELIADAARSLRIGCATTTSRASSRNSPKTCKKSSTTASSRSTRGAWPTRWPYSPK